MKASGSLLRLALSISWTAPLITRTHCGLQHKPVGPNGRFSLSSRGRLPGSLSLLVYNKPSGTNTHTHSTICFSIQVARPTVPYSRKKKQKKNNHGF
jgi:hypothetical protein